MRPLIEKWTRQLFHSAASSHPDCREDYSNHFFICSSRFLSELMRLFVGLTLVTTLASTYPDLTLVQRNFDSNETDTVTFNIDTVNINVTSGETVYLECRLKCDEYIPETRISITPPSGTFHSQSPPEKKCPMITYMNYTATSLDSSTFSCDFYNGPELRKKVKVTVRVKADTADASSQTEDGKSDRNSFVIVSCIAVAAIICMLLMCYQQHYFKRELRHRELQSQDIRMHRLPGDLGEFADFEIAERNVKRDRGRSPLGHGNFGHVYSGYLKTMKEFTLFGYSCWYFSSKTAVAIKEPIQACTWGNDSDYARETVLNELKVLCQNGTHPNIINLIGAVLSERVFVVVEKCDNGDLSNYLRNNATSFVPQYQDFWTLTHQQTFDVMKQRGNLEFGYKQGFNKDKWTRIIKSGLTTAHLFSFGLQIAEGMQYLVSRNCIHRDLAARNILLTSKRVVKITDFGLSRRLREKDYYRSNTGAGHIKWMALEAIAENIESVYTDIWSFGIVLVELFLLGAEPYSKTKNIPSSKGKDSNPLFEFLRAGGRPERPYYCPPLIYEHMMKCWRVEPKERPNFTQSAQFLEIHLRAASSELLDITRSNIQKEEINLKKYSDYRISKKPSANLETLSKSRNVPKAEHDGYRQNV